MSRRNNRRGKYDKQQYVYREDPSRNSSGEELPPHVVTRFFLGCITQPLDSIEKYFGERWHSTSHGCSIRHHTWCFYQCPAHSLCPRLSSKSALSSLQWTTSKLLSARYYLSTHDRGPTCARLWSIPSRGNGPQHSLHESYGRQSRPP